MALSSTTRRIDADVDLLDVAGADGVVFERDRDGVAGRGVAASWTVDSCHPDALADVQARLAAIASDDDVGVPGSGPVAFAALPFDPSRPATFVVPATTVGRDNRGTRWITRIDGGEDAPSDLSATDTTRAPRPASFRVEATQDPEDWKAMVADATARIATGAFDKVVLAREVEITANVAIDRAGLLSRLRGTFPGCWTFGVADLIGASPELLVARSGEVVRAHPMAGTAPRGGDPTTDARLAASLLASTKDRAEHQITIDMVWETLLPFCSYVDSEPEPSVVAVANVQHLASLVEGRLSAPPASVLELVAALHPTPAVAGWPLAPALAHIEAHEPIDRDRYAGAVGWVDAAGNGTWAVGIRSAIVSGTVARIFAGVGVVADSDPESELAETEAKFQAILSAIVRP